jgi:NAD(P)-dependent dehydrogenase (short-subunit alcohol dehydrogenase family)
VIKGFHSKHEFLDGIYINAGLGYAPKREVTEDGLDPHFQVNYLSQFMLTLNLLDLLEKSENGGLNLNGIMVVLPSHGTLYDEYVLEL